MALRTQRTHDDKQVARATEKFGFVDPTSGIAIRHALGQRVAAKVKKATKSG